MALNGLIHTSWTFYKKHIKNLSNIQSIHFLHKLMLQQIALENKPVYSAGYTHVHESFIKSYQYDLSQDFCGFHHEINRRDHTSQYDF